MNTAYQSSRGGNNSRPALLFTIPLLLKSAILAFLLGSFLSGCATYSGTMSKVVLNAESGNYDQALTVLEKSSLASARKDRLLFLLEKGTLLNLDEDYAASNEAFELAERTSEEFYGISISNELKGAILNDTLMEYPGEDFERVMLHYLRALNYLALEKQDEALVECRKSDNLLRQISDRLEGKNVYREDALAHYLAGILYEADRNPNDAFIAYRAAYKLYTGDYKANYGTPPPPFLLADLARTAKGAGLTDELVELCALTGVSPPSGESDDPTSSELVLFFDNGWAPRKQRKDIYLPVPASDLLLPVKFSVPEFIGRPPDVAFARVLVDGAEAGRTYLVENVGAIAVKNLDDRIGRKVVKTVARVAAKQAALEVTVNKIRKEHGENAAAFARLGMQLALNFSEAADIRSWQTLPWEVQLARLPVTPGTHHIALELVDRHGRTVEEEELGVIYAPPGKKAFLQYRNFR